MPVRQLNHNGYGHTGVLQSCQHPIIRCGVLCVVQKSHLKGVCFLANTGNAVFHIIVIASGVQFFPFALGQIADLGGVVQALGCGAGIVGIYLNAFGRKAGVPALFRSYKILLNQSIDWFLCLPDDRNAMICANNRWGRVKARPRMQIAGSGPARSKPRLPFPSIPTGPARS